LNLVSRFWPTLIKLPSTNTIQDHYEVLVKYLKLCLSFSLQNYSWFIHIWIMKMVIMSMPNLLWVCILNHFICFHFLIFQVISCFMCWKNDAICFLLLTLNFVCSWLCLLLIDYMMAFVALKRRNQCLPLGLLFQNNVNIIAYLTMNHHKGLKTRRNWPYY